MMKIVLDYWQRLDRTSPPDNLCWEQLLEALNRSWAWLPKVRSLPGGQE